MRRAMVALAVFSAALPVHSAVAAKAAPTFDGRCQFSGVVRFLPPLTNFAQPATDVADATGTCSGSLTRNGRTRTLDGAPVRYFATDHGDASCGEGISTGWGDLQFHPGGRVYFALDEQRAAALAHLEMTGFDAGQAEGAANVNQNADPVAVVAACNGTGLAQAPVDINLATTSPLAGRHRRR